MDKNHECHCHEHGYEHEHEHNHEHEHGHGEHHHHHHGEGENRLTRIIAGAILLAAAVIIEKKTDWATWQHLLLYLIPYLTVGWETLKEAAEGLLHGRMLGEDFLMSVATLGALGIGFLPDAQTQFPEAVFVMLFFQLGEWFEERAEGKSRRSIAHLMDIRPDSAHVLRDGELQTLPPDQVAPGETILIQPGEKCPWTAWCWKEAPAWTP